VSLWWRRPEQREHSAPTTFGQLSAQLAAARSFADVDVTGSPEGALQSTAVWAAADLIASIASELPIDVLRGSGADRKELPTPGWLQDPDGSGYGLEDWRYRVMMSWLLRGNAFGMILSRSAAGYLQQVDLLAPDSVSGWMEGGAVRWAVGGRTVPEHDLGDVLHRRVNPMPGHVLGLSPVQVLARSVGVNIASSRYGLQWFSDGAHPSGLLVNTEEVLEKEQADTAKARFLAALRGNREPLVLGKGWDYKQLQITPEESQFLETQGFSAAECARIFGPGLAEILGYESGGSMTYSNVVDRGLHLLTYSLNKWLRRLERLLSDFLPRPQYVRINRNALLETSALQRYQAYQTALQNHWRTVNEVRDLEDLPAVPWGDAPMVAPAPAAAGDPEDPDDPAADGGQGEE